MATFPGLKYFGPTVDDEEAYLAEDEYKPTREEIETYWADMEGMPFDMPSEEELTDMANLYDTGGELPEWTFPEAA